MKITNIKNLDSSEGGTLFNPDNLNEESLLSSFKQYVQNDNMDNEELQLFLDKQLGKAYTFNNKI